MAEFSHVSTYYGVTEVSVPGIGSVYPGADSVVVIMTKSAQRDVLDALRDQFQISLGYISTNALNKDPGAFLPELRDSARLAELFTAFSGND